MKIEELMIGNIYFDDTQTLRYVTDISKTNPESFVGHLSNGRITGNALCKNTAPCNRNIMCKIEDCSPIPVTSENFEKIFGFKRQECYNKIITTFIIELEDTILEVVIREKDNYVSIHYTREDDIIVNYPLWNCYIHELQNIIKIVTKKELKYTIK